LAGCCFGRATELPWGVVLPAVDLVRRHPVQLYAAAADCLLAVWAAAEPSRTGRATWRALVGYGCARIVLETWRDPAGSDVVGLQAFAVARLGGVALVLLGLALRMRGLGRVDGALVQMGRDDSPCANG